MERFWMVHLMGLFLLDISRRCSELKWSCLNAIHVVNLRDMSGR